MHIELDVERPVAGGDMIARHEGRIVFVRGALPGERVRARIVRRKGQLAWATVAEVLTPSDDRRGEADPIACGGLTWQHIAVERQRALKADIVADAFRRLAKHPLEQPVPVHASPEQAYRMRARLHVHGRQIGFYREGTHQVCDPAATAQLRPDTLEAAVRLHQSLGDAAGACEAISVSESVDAGTRVAVCELRPEASADPFIGLPLTDGLTGIAISTPGGVFTSAGTDAIVEHGSALLDAQWAWRDGVRWQRRGAAFFQSNRFMIAPLLNHVVAVAQGDYFVDGYAGVGLFAIALAARGAEGVAVEGEPVSSRDLELNARSWTGLRVASTSMEDAVVSPMAWRPDVVVVDPPRTGLTPAVVDGVLAWEAPRLVYVSCDVPTLARDAQRLLASGYQLTSLEAFDMFPNTPHIECVAVLERAR
jgi:23S rRNA (uracil1939-C5)-methyltransferase